MGQQVVSHGVINWTKEDHWGFTNKTPVMLKVVNGDWKIE
jgi:branched-chain amino acid transport system substrate-binding protein